MTDETIIRLKAEKGKLIATRLNQTSVIHCYSDCQTKKTGEANVDSQKLGEMLSNVPTEELTLELKGDELWVTSGKAIGKFKTVNTEDLLPEPEEQKSDRDLVFKAGQLKTLLEVTTPAMGVEAQKRPNTEGITLQTIKETIQFIACDSRRLHMADTGMEEEIHDFMPNQVCGALQKIAGMLEPQADVTIGFSEGAIFFHGSNCEFRSAKMEVTPFDYKRFPIWDTEVESEITVPKQDLIAAIKLAVPFGFHSFKVIGLNIKDGELEIEANTEKGAECKQSVEGESEGESQTRISAPYFMEILNCTNGSDKLTIKKNKQPGAIFIQGDDRLLWLMEIRDARAAPQKQEAEAVA